MIHGSILIYFFSFFKSNTIHEKRGKPYIFLRQEYTKKLNIYDIELS